MRSYRVRRNDWSAVHPPQLGAWTPTLPVSVVIPARGSQAKLDLTLAALSQQTYPADLLEVVVVDDASDPPLQLPDMRPANCRLVRLPADSRDWGPATARHAGADAASGDVIHWLDSDMVVYPEHVEAQVRWHHVLPEAVTIGYKRFIEAPLPTPADVVKHAAGKRMESLFPMDESHPHEWVERFIARRDGLRRGRSVYHVHVGATAALKRDLYQAAGGLDKSLHLGEDTELGYRLEQVGAVFIPEPLARSWHLGHTSMMRDGDQLRRYNRPHLEHRMPLYPGWRRDPGRRWAVPAVVAVVEVADQPAEVVEDCLARLLGSYDDLRVILVGPWDRLHPGRRAVLEDPDIDLRIIRAGIGTDPRVSLAVEAPATVFPSPLRLDVPPTCAVGARTVSRLVDRIEAGELGLLEVVAHPADRGPSTERSGIEPDSGSDPHVVKPALSDGSIAPEKHDSPQPAPGGNADDVARPTPDPDAPGTAASIPGSPPPIPGSAPPDPGSPPTLPGSAPLVPDSTSPDPGSAPPIPPSAPPERVARLWRTSAVSRARRIMGPGEDLRTVVDEVWGRATVDGGDVGIHLTPVPELGTRVPIPWPRLETDADVGALERRIDELARKLAQVRTPWGWVRDRGAYLVHRLRRRQRRRP